MRDDEDESRAEPLPLPRIVDRAEWLVERADLLTREKAHTREGDAIAAARRRLPMTPVGEATVIGARGAIPFADVFEGRRTLIAYTFMWNHARPFSEQCAGCTFSASQLPAQTYLSQRDATFAMLCEGRWNEISAYRDFMGWSHPWYSTSTALDNPAVAGEKQLRCYLRDGHDVYLTYEATDRGTEVMDPVLGLLDRTAYGRRESWENSPSAWPQSAAGDWWRRDGRPVAQWEPAHNHVEEQHA